MQVMIAASDKTHAKKIANKMVKKGEKIDEFEFVGRRFGLSNYKVSIKRK